MGTLDGESPAGERETLVTKISTGLFFLNYLDHQLFIWEFGQHGGKLFSELRTMGFSLCTVTKSLD